MASRAVYNVAVNEYLAVVGDGRPSQELASGALVLI
jgi:hypothetical protein